MTTIGTVYVSDEQINTHKQALKGRSKHDKYLSDVQHCMVMNKYDAYLPQDTHLSQSAFNSLKEHKRIDKRLNDGRGKKNHKTHKN
jgi:hypothetical protein